jgi:hypothetical protein
MKDYLKTYASIIALIGFVLTLVVGFAFNIYLNSRNSFIDSEQLKFHSAVTVVERDVDDLKAQLDGSVLGMDRSSKNGYFQFYVRGSDLMAKHTQMAEREIVIQSDGTEPFQASIGDFLKSDYLLVNSRGEQISFQSSGYKFLSDTQKVFNLTKKISESEKQKPQFLILDAQGKFLSTDFNLKNFFRSKVLLWSRPVYGSDLNLVHVATFSGFMPILFNVLFFAALLCLPFLLSLFVIRRKVAKAYTEIGNWVQATSVSLRFGRPVMTPATKSVSSQALPLLTSIQEAFSKTSPLLSYSGGDYIAQEFNLVTWNCFRKNISLWLCGQQGDFDVENGKDWIVCAVSAARDSVLDTFVREANGALLSKKMFIYQYSDSTVILALRVASFEESLELIKSLVKNTASRESFAAHDIVIDAVYGSKSTSTFGEWFVFFENHMRKVSGDDKIALINKEVARFYLHSSKEKVMSLNWIQLMAGVRNWLQLKAPEQNFKETKLDESSQRAPEVALRPRKFSRPLLTTPGKESSV